MGKLSCGATVEEFPMAERPLVDNSTRADVKREEARWSRGYPNIDRDIFTYISTDTRGAAFHFGFGTAGRKTKAKKEKKGGKSEQC